MRRARVCDTCGTAWDDTARWCAWCGAALDPPRGSPSIERPNLSSAADELRRDAIQAGVVGVGVVVVVVALAFGVGTGRPPGASDAAGPATEDPSPEPSAGALACSRGGQMVEGCLEVLADGVQPGQLHVLGDLLLLADDDGDLAARDPASGDVAWSLSRAEVGMVRGARAVESSVVLLAADGLLVVDAEDGRRRWARAGDVQQLAVAPHSSSGAPRVLVREGTVLSALRHDDGTAVWDADLAGLVAAPQSLHVAGATDDVLLLRYLPDSWVADSLFVLDRADGSLRWSLALGTGSTVLATPSTVVAVTRQEDRGDGEELPVEVTVTGHDDLTGTALWSHRERWTHVPADSAVPVGVRLGLRGSDQTTVLDLDDGTVVAQRPASGPLLAEGALGEVRDDAGRDEVPLVVAEGSSLRRVDPGTAEVLWSVAVEPSGRGVVTADRVLWTGSNGTAVLDAATGDEIATLLATGEVVSVDPFVVWEGDRLLRLPPSAPLPERAADDDEAR